MAAMNHGRRYLYQIALSFAGEDRPYAARVAAVLRDAKVRVFFDEFERLRLLGKDLAVELRNIYSRSRYVVVFVSAHYRDKQWPRYEIRSALSLEVERGPGSLIQARLDDTELPELLPTTGYQDLQHVEPEEFARLLIEKLGRRAVRRPRRRAESLNEALGRDRRDAAEMKASSGGGLGPISTSVHDTFYLPLTLGTRRHRSGSTLSRKLPDSERAARRSDRSGSDSWHEGVEKPPFDAVHDLEIPEVRILDELRTQAAAMRSGYWVVLGEPGAGKSTLFVRWFHRWGGELRATPVLAPGQPVPVLVRLREFTNTNRDISVESLADQLWSIGKEEAVQLGQRIQDNVYRHSGWRRYSPVWLLDGLDELRDDLRSPAFLRRFANLPGQAVVSCRTAVYQALRSDASLYAASDREYVILGLRSQEQRAFLEGMLPDSVLAGPVHDALANHPALRPLAANPLMLSLVAQLPHPERLPTTRAEFYARATESMWHRKLTAEISQQYLALTQLRDSLLCSIATELSLERIQGPLSLLVGRARAIAPDADQWTVLADWVARSGIVRLDHRFGRFEFFHLTFQEYYLAQSLERDGVRAAFETYWENPRYEETLGLLTSRQLESGHIADIDQGIRWLVLWGEELHREDPQILWDKQRSPLRVALNVLSRAALRLETPQLTSLASFLWDRVSSALAMRIAVAADPGTPSHLIARLVKDANERVRTAAASNPSAPPHALAFLAGDVAIDVRAAVSANPNAPADSLARLATDSEFIVRREVAKHPSTPPDTLVYLTDDSDSSTRYNVARHPNTPSSALARLANDQGGQHVLSAVAENPATPPEIASRLESSSRPEAREARSWNTSPGRLAELADRLQGFLRSEIAANPSTPVDTLKGLAADPDPTVSSRLARNARAPRDVLEVLAMSTSEYTRKEVAANRNSPASVLRELASDSSLDVRAAALRNPNMPPDVLAAFANTSHSRIRQAVAANRSTPAHVLAGLASDRTVAVRSSLARNPILPRDRLGRLAEDLSQAVREAAAENTRAPADVLSRLANDADRSVRLAVLTNPMSPSEVLSQLGADADALLRLKVAGDPRTPAAVLARLARDADSQVRWEAALNPATLLEDLAALER
jgi:hypothetical protein